MKNHSVTPDLAVTLTEVIAQADAEFYGRHPELRGCPLTDDAKARSAWHEWNEIFGRRALQIVRLHRDAVEAGRLVGSA